jgi:hypothetical protein
MKPFAVAGSVAVLFALALGVDGRLAAAPVRPSLVLSANPMIGVAPLKVRFKADLKGGADDDKEYYCLAVEWDWDDGTTSEFKRDCPPYEAGKTQIERHFTSEHEYKEEANYRVIFRLKRGDKVLLSSTLVVQVH